jgi:WD40 repeat protein
VYGGFGDGLICSWNMKSGDISSVFKGHSKAISELEFLNARLLVSASLDASIRIWDTMVSLVNLS